MDNFHTQCPPRMSDARFLTDYRPAVMREEANKKAAGVNIVRDDEYRQYLQQNSTKLINRERVMAKAHSCKPKSCVHSYPTRVTNQQLADEMAAYNNQSNGVVYMCESFPDYYATL